MCDVVLNLLHSFAYEDCKKLNKIYDVRPFSDFSCNSIDFNQDGTSSYVDDISQIEIVIDFFNSFSDGSVTIHDLEKETILNCYSNPKKTSCTLVRSINRNLFVAAYECGDLKICDQRLSNEVVSAVFAHPDEIVNDVACHPSKNDLIVTVSSNGFLDAYNLSKNKLIDQSDPQLYDLVSVAFYSQKKVLVGTGSDDGCINVFNVGEWGNSVDRVMLKTNSSIDYISVLSNECVLFGCADGPLMLYSLYPHREIGKFGGHIKAPLLGMTVSNDERIVASLLENTVYFWNIAMPDVTTTHIKPTKRKQKNVSSFYDDM